MLVGVAWGVAFVKFCWHLMSIVRFMLGCALGLAGLLLFLAGCLLVSCWFFAVFCWFLAGFLVVSCAPLWALAGGLAGGLAGFLAFYFGFAANRFRPR